MLDVLLQPTQQVRREHLVQGFHLPRRGHGPESSLELIPGREPLGVDKVEQRPKLGGVVLERGTGEQHHPPGKVERAQVPLRLPAAVLEPVSLVNHQARPRNLRQRRSIRLHRLVRGQHDIRPVHDILIVRVLATHGNVRVRTHTRGGRSVTVGDLVAAYARARGGGTDVGDDVRARHPPSRLPLPVHQRGQGDDDERRTPRAQPGLALRPEHVIDERE